MRIAGTVLYAVAYLNKFNCFVSCDDILITWLKYKINKKMIKSMNHNYTHVNVYIYACTSAVNSCMHTHMHRVLSPYYTYMYMLTSGAEGRKKEASKVIQTTKQSNTTHQRQSLFRASFGGIQTHHTLYTRQSTVDMYMYMYIHTHIHVYIHMYTCTHVYMYNYMGTPCLHLDCILWPHLSQNGAEQLLPLLQLLGILTEEEVWDGQLHVRLPHAGWEGGHTCSAHSHNIVLCSRECIV